MDDTTAFESAEEAWFWFMQAHQARKDGANIRANNGNIIRPCDPDDVLKILDRLYRHRQLDMNHFRVLRHYGERMMAPEPDRPREYTAYRLWTEAMNLMGDIMVRKNIVRMSLSAEIICFQNRKAMEVASW